MALIEYEKAKQKQTQSTNDQILQKLLVLKIANKQWTTECVIEQYTVRKKLKRIDLLFAFRGST